MPDAQPRGYTAYLIALIVLGSALFAASVALLIVAALAGAAWPSLWRGLALAAALAVGAYLILHDLLLFQWRGQQVALGPDEVLMLVALYALPAPLVILFAFPAMTAFQFETKRPLLRGATNVAVMLLASGAAALTYLALHGRAVPDIVAALAGMIVYTPVTFGLVSVAFALREGTSPLTVYRERFLTQTGLHLALGATGGLIAIGLWTFHPLALLAMVPLVWGTRAFVQQLARKDRETRVHERLGEVAHDLAGEPSLEIVAARVLDACLEVFRAGRATITLNANATEGGAARRWTRDAESGHDLARAPLAEIIPGPEGPVGAIVVHASRSTKEGFTAADRAVLRIVAGGAASYVAHARAITDLDASQKALLTQRVSRPLVRRIVRTVMEESHADYTVLSRLGNGLARDAEAGDLDTLCRAYEEMGLGTLHVASTRGQYVFVGTDLFERHPGAHATTCHIALGFLCGAVSRLHVGRTARGSEIECQSRGDSACRFVVQAREPELGPVTRIGYAEKP